MEKEKMTFFEYLTKDKKNLVRFIMKIVDSDAYELYRFVSDSTDLPDKLSDVKKVNTRLVLEALMDERKERVKL